MEDFLSKNSLALQDLHFIAVYLCSRNAEKYARIHIKKKKSDCSKNKGWWVGSYETSNVVLKLRATDLMVLFGIPHITVIEKSK